jgi:transglutaminase-like putative cysteine protease
MHSHNTSRIAQLRPTPPTRDIAHSNSDSLLPPNQDDKPLAARDARVEKVPLHPTRWSRVQAICDFVHNHIIFGYEYSRATRTAFEAYQERRGVCRDYALLRSPSAVA